MVRLSECLGVGVVCPRCLHFLIILEKKLNCSVQPYCATLASNHKKCFHDSMGERPNCEGANKETEAERVITTNVHSPTSQRNQPPGTPGRYRILVIASHVVQSASPLYRALASHPEVDLEVAYCSLRGAEPGHDPEFGRIVQWDIPLLDGYSWQTIPNYPLRSNEESFFGICNPDLWRIIRKNRFDAVICFISYIRATFWIVLAAAKLHGVPLLFGTDASSLEPKESRNWIRKLKVSAKRIFWPTLFGLADQVPMPAEC